MIDRMIYMAVALVLGCVFLFDETFSANLFRAFDEPTAILSLNPWVAVVGFLFLLLAAVALYRELKR